MRHAGHDAGRDDPRGASVDQAGTGSTQDARLPREFPAPRTITGDVQGSGYGPWGRRAQEMVIRRRLGGVSGKERKAPALTPRGGPPTLTIRGRPLVWVVLWTGQDIRRLKRRVGKGLEDASPNEAELRAVAPPPCASRDYADPGFGLPSDGHAEADASGVQGVRVRPGGFAHQGAQAGHRRDEVLSFRTARPGP